MNIYEKIATRIILEQELIMGPIAWSEAAAVSGLRLVSTTTGEVVIEGADTKQVIDALVAQYTRLFGRASQEASREAVAGLLAELPDSEVPSSLIAL